MSEQSLGKRIKQLRGESRREAIAKVVSDFESSKLPASSFCKSAGIAPVTLSRWQRELRAGATRRKATPPIVEVRPTRSARCAPFEVTLPTGVVLRVPSGFDGAELERLLSLLHSAC